MASTAGSRSRSTRGGRYLRTVNETRPAPGNGMVLTIDLRYAEDGGAGIRGQGRCGGRHGCANRRDPGLCQQPRASIRRFSPGACRRTSGTSTWTDKRHPLENKALKGQYPPGSTFKIITALAGLEEGLIDANTTINCTGYVQVRQHHLQMLGKAWARPGRAEKGPQGVVRRLFLPACRAPRGGPDSPDGPVNSAWARRWAWGLITRRGGDSHIGVEREKVPARNGSGAKPFRWASARGTC